MTDRYTIRLRGPADLERLSEAFKWLAQRVGQGWVIDIANRRTNDQSRLLHAIIDEYRSARAQEAGRRLESRDVWKQRFLHAWRGDRFIDGLDDPHTGEVQPIPFKPSTADLTKQECSELIELIMADAAVRGITFKDAET